jgi:hypothetical protein
VESIGICDVGYVDHSQRQYVVSIGDTDLVFLEVSLEVFPTAEYQDISLGEWLSHTSSRLINQHPRHQRGVPGEDLGLGNENKSGEVQLRRSAPSALLRPLQKEFFLA